MKHSIKIILIEIVLIIASLLCLFLYKINYYAYLVLLVLTVIGLYLFLKSPKRNERFNNDINLIIIICILFYYAITNFIGFFSGFYYSGYSKEFLGILLNIVSSVIIIGSIETIREILIKNYAYHKSIVLLTPIVCLLLELPSIINFSLYTTKVDMFNVFINLIIPNLIKNITLTYIVFKANKKSSMLYQFLITIPNFFLPVFPNLGDFFSIIANISLPVIVLIVGINVTTVKFATVTNSRLLGKSSKLEIAFQALLILIVIGTLYLTSNMFRFSSLAIGSNSMAKIINKGDIVIIDKKSRKINEGDVIAFEQGGRIIVHRAIEILEDNGEKVYITKGDANKDSDGWTAGDRNLVGKVLLKIKWLGWPTVALSELISG
ncbi:MAG: signal peptidase I [Bacilli bacterium]|nr:signal peptidase I [Bacilli bacterium]